MDIFYCQACEKEVEEDPMKGVGNQCGFRICMPCFHNSVGTGADAVKQFKRLSKLEAEKKELEPKKPPLAPNESPF